MTTKNKRKTLILTDTEFKAISRMANNAFEFARFGLDLRWERRRAGKTTAYVEAFIDHQGGVSIRHERKASKQLGRLTQEHYDSTAAMRFAYASWEREREMRARARRQERASSKLSEDHNDWP